MQVLRQGHDLEQFLAAVARHPGQSLLLLDYDGTLAPFQKERDKAVPYPGVVDALTHLQRLAMTRLVVISGRSAREIPELLKLDPVPEIWGSHGWERRSTDGTYSIAPLGDGAKQGLDEAYAAVIQAGALQHCERKPVSVALHWREVTQDSFRAPITEKWRTIAEGHSLQIHNFDGGAEIRVPGRDKGFAVRTILAEMEAGTPVAYLGDDLTDEDAFASVGDTGIAVLVRQDYRETCAHIWLRPPEELLDFLTRWGNL